MWQRFTERARRVVYFAQEEAARLGESFVSTEHLLLGLVREKDSAVCRLLDKMGVSLSGLRSEIERQVPHGEGRLSHDMALTPRAKRVMDLAYDEARQLNSNYIGTEHLLLALIREGEGLAGRVLDRIGVDLARTRSQVKEMQETDAGRPAEPARPRQVRQRLYKLVSVVGDAGEELGALAERVGLALTELAADRWQQVSMSHSFADGRWSVLVSLTKQGWVTLEDQGSAESADA
jgi:ATP-dependent Clp protease ATP-binding subunit ClpA